MLKRIIIALLAFLSGSVFLLSVVFLVLSTYILRPENIYIQLQEADAYTRLSEYLGSNLRNIGGEYGALIENQLQFEEIVTTTVNNNLELFLAWFGGESTEWYVYVPIDILEAQLGQGQLEQIINETLTSQIVNKRTCTAAETQQFEALLQVNSVAELEQNPNLNLPDCFPSDPIYRQQAEKLAAEIVAAQNEADPVFDQLRRELGLEGVEATMTAAQFEEFINAQSRRNLPASATSNSDYDFSLSPVYDAQWNFQIARTIAVVGLGASFIVLLLLAAWKGKFLVSWSKLMTSQGIALMINGVLLLILARLAVNQGSDLAIQQANLPLTTSQQQLIAEFQTRLISYLDTPYLIILGLGTAITITFITLRIVLARRRKVAIKS